MGLACKAVLPHCRGLECSRDSPESCCAQGWAFSITVDHDIQSSGQWTRLSLPLYPNYNLQDSVSGFQASLLWPYFHTLIQAFIHSLIHTFTHACIHSFRHSFIHSFIIHSHMHSLIHSFIHSLTHAFTHSGIHSFTHSYIHSCMHSFNHSFTQQTSTQDACHVPDVVLNVGKSSQYSPAPWDPAA